MPTRVCWERRHQGLGLVAVSALGGLAGSASSTTAVASLATHGRVDPRHAAGGAIAASIATLFVNLPIVYRRFGSPLRPPAGFYIRRGLYLWNRDRHRGEFPDRNVRQ